MDVATLAELLLETSDITTPTRRPPRSTTGGTGTSPPSTPASTGAPEEASDAARLYTEEVRHLRPR